MTSFLLCLFFLFGCLVQQTVPLESCSRIDDAVDVETLSYLVRNVTHVFIDIDETLVLPKTPFIYGLPKSDAYMSHLSLTCDEETVGKLAGVMEDTYYDSPIQLVDEDFPGFIHNLQIMMDKDVVKVFGLTSRGNNEPIDKARNLKLIDALQQHGIQFSRLESSFPFASNTEVGGILWADGEYSNKGRIMIEVLNADLGGSGPKTAFLIDNTRRKLEAAIKTPELCLQGVHFTKSYSLEVPFSEKKDWVCQQLTRMQRSCKSLCEQ